MSMLLGCVHSFGILLVVFICVQGVVGDGASSHARVGRVTLMRARAQV